MHSRNASNTAKRFSPMDNITIFGMKHSHIVAIECALYLYEKLADGGHMERLGDEESRLRASFVTSEDDGFFSPKLNWLDFAGGLILAIGTADRSIAHRIKAVAN